MTPIHTNILTKQQKCCNKFIASKINFCEKNTTTIKKLNAKYNEDY